MGWVRGLGYIYRPKELLQGRKRMLKQGLEDITPDTRKEVYKILQDWRGDSSMARLIKLIGEEKAKELTKRIDYS